MELERDGSVVDISSCTSCSCPDSSKTCISRFIRYFLNGDVKGPVLSWIRAHPDRIDDSESTVRLMSESSSTSEFSLSDDDDDDDDDEHDGSSAALLVSWTDGGG